ncbi:MAG: DNA internalization-related competence protein ComEC/Rec2 [Bacilli bacterium]|nr:DNA internalization-related competence protein ComEC/Rec2 [Bacilli bacterium]
MLRFRKLLLCDFLYYGFFSLAILFTIFQIHIQRTSYYSFKTKEVVGTITSIQEKEGRIIYQIKAEELLLVYTNQPNSFVLGDVVKVYGDFQKPESYTDKNLWNYEEYLLHKKIYFTVQAKSIMPVKHNRNIYYRMKQAVINRIHKNPYLSTFILGDKSFLSSRVIRSYQENGISHLFAISGMHISLLASLLEKLLKKRFNEYKRYSIIILFLLFYLCLVGFSPSIVRGVSFYIVFQGNRLYYFYIKKENLFLFVLSISLFLNPFYVYDVGFQYSYFISYALLKMSSVLNSQSKWMSLLKVSSLSFLVSIPITLKNYNQLNFFSVIYNLFYVPYVSYIVFPLSLITILFPPIEFLYNFLTSILEITSFLLLKNEFGKLIWKQVPNYVYGFYFVLLLFYLSFKNKKLLFGFFLLLFVHFLIPYFNHTEYVKVLNVGQGDSTLIHISQKTILIDTGGKGKNGTLFYNVLNPLLKKEGVSHINYLVLSHGDFDHMGEAINLVNNFKVEKVIFNCGSYNDLEKELIKVLDKKKIKYYSCIKELNIDKNKLYFLQTKEYDNENDNSNVIYTELDGYKFMFMGDASTTTEKEILNNYNLPDIDILKVGHHGSRTSSGKEFINEINPKYSIISVGKNNRYGHPNKEVLENLENSKIYRTDQDGSIMFKIKNNKLRIETCSP